MQIRRTPFIAAGILWIAPLASAQFYNEARDKMYAALKNPDRTELEAVIKDKLQPSAEAYLGTLSQLKAFEDHLADERIAEVAAEVHTTQMTLITLAALSLVAGVLGAIVITRSVTRPLMEAVSAAQVIAGKDLSQRLDSARKDELARMLGGQATSKAKAHAAELLAEAARTDARAASEKKPRTLSRGPSSTRMTTLCPWAAAARA